MNSRAVNKKGQYQKMCFESSSCKELGLHASLTTITTKVIGAIDINVLQQLLMFNTLSKPINTFFSKLDFMPLALLVLRPRI